MNDSTESVRIRSDVAEKLREFLAKKHRGRLYGKIGEAIETAVMEWISRQEGLDDTIDYKLLVNNIHRMIENEISNKTP